VTSGKRSNEDLSPTRIGSGGRSLVMNNLVAIGTAAVLTVYAAGYVRTRGAALRFAEAEAAARRPPSAAVPVGEPAVATVAAVPPPVRPETAAIMAATDSQHGNPAAVATSSPVTGGSVVPAESALAVADSSAAKTPVGDSTPAAPPMNAATPMSAAPVVDSVSAQAAADTAGKRGPYRDGQYFGWGTSRHGDIQAGIEIKDGHITGAWVAQCLTRYSCSWIAALPGQVVARQSPVTDYISGATQSTNAFYYAVVEALSKAK
jgi:uncharacterized protein with FMN-binding domain